MSDLEHEDLSLPQDADASGPSVPCGDVETFAGGSDPVENDPETPSRAEPLARDSEAGGELHPAFDRDGDRETASDVLLPGRAGTTAFLSTHLSGVLVFAGVTCIAALIAVFYLACGLIFSNPTGRIVYEESSIERETAPLEDAKLPYLPSRVEAINTSGYPTIKVSFSISPQSGRDVPPLVLDDVSITESDEAGEKIEICAANLEFSQKTGRGSLILTTKSSAPSERTIDVRFKKSTGYRGGFEASFIAPDA